MQVGYVDMEIGRQTKRQRQTYMQTENAKEMRRRRVIC